MSEPAQIAIVGGGITGLTVAYRLTQLQAQRDLRVTVFEADERCGGKIRTEQFAGRPLDAGAEALLTRVPAAASLCRELGLGDDLVSPATDRPYIWTRGRLRALPPRLLAGVPDGVGALASSGILSWPGMLRAGFDLVVPSRPLSDDVTIGQLVRRRLGNEVHERLIDPLLGGIHGGSCDELSVRAVAPQLELAIDTRKGLVRGLRALVAGAPTGPPAGPSAGPSAGPPAGPPAPMFLSLTGGLAELIDALRGRLDGSGPASGHPAADLRTGARVTAIEPVGDGRVRVLLDGDGSEPIFDHVVLAVPAFAAAGMLEDASDGAAAALRRIGYASVATILLEYGDDALREPLVGSGFLVPRTEGRMITACTWSSNKWSHLAGPGIVVKASVGRDGDASALELNDQQLIERVHAELAAAMGLRQAPLQGRVARFERALPQYRVGHLDLVAGIEAALTPLGGVSIAGAAYRGVGVASCIRDGEAAAARLADGLALGAGQLTQIAQ